MSEKVNRPSGYDLWIGVQNAKRQFPVGTEWQHYSTGDVYEIIGHGVDEDTGEPEVRYIRAAPLSDGRTDRRVVSVGDSPRDYIREVEFHRLLRYFASATDKGPRFTPVRRCEHFEKA